MRPRVVPSKSLVIQYLVIVIVTSVVAFSPSPPFHTLLSTDFLFQTSLALSVHLGSSLICWLCEDTEAIT